jgi:integrase
MKVTASVMKDKLFLKVGTYEKYVDFNDMKPTTIAIHYKAYLRYHKQRRSKAESSLYTEVKMIRYLFTFLDNKRITSLHYFTYLHMQELFSFLNTVTSKQGKHLSKSSQRLVYTFFKSFASWLSEYYPSEAPAMHLFAKSPYKRNNAHLKTEYFTDDVLKQIKDALRVEEDILTKAYVLIALYYGLRSSDIVTLRYDCLHSSDKEGKYDLHYIDHKQNEAVTIAAIATPVSRIIFALMRHTEALRKKASLPYIFLTKDHKGNIKLLAPYQKNRLDKFVKNHSICDSAKVEIKMHSHMFRRTLATNLQSSGVALETTQRLLNHKSNRTTLKHYIKTKEKDYIEQISSTLTHMQLVAAGQEKEYLHLETEGTDALRLSDGYCTNTAMATDPNYICEQLKRRANCYGCEKMVTTPEFLPYFKTLLQEKEVELSSYRQYGEHLNTHLHFEKTLISELIIKLEAL